MRRQLFCGAIGILASLTLVGCDPYYYSRGYYGYGYGPYQYPYYGYDVNGGYTFQQARYAIPQSLSQTSYNFAINLALNNAYQIDAGQLAAQRSAYPQVRQFANRVVSGNATVDQDLTAALQRNGTPVVRPAALDPRHQAMIDDLTTAQGPEFDRRFVVQQVAVHREAITLLQNYARNGDNPALRQLAQRSLQAAQAGLQSLRTLPGAAGV